MEIREVTSRRDLDKFIKLPRSIYVDDPNWVPPLIRDEKRFLDPAHNPFFKHAEVEHFLAWRNGEAVGFPDQRVKGLQST